MKTYQTPREDAVFMAYCGISAIARFLNDRGSWGAQAESKGTSGPDPLTADEELGLSLLCKMAADMLRPESKDDSEGGAS